VSAGVLSRHISHSNGTFTTTLARLFQRLRSLRRRSRQRLVRADVPFLAIFPIPMGHYLFSDPPFGRPASPDQAALRRLGGRQAQHDRTAGGEPERLPCKSPGFAPTGGLSVKPPVQPTQGSNPACPITLIGSLPAPFRPLPLHLVVFVGNDEAATGPEASNFPGFIGP